MKEVAGSNLRFSCQKNEVVTVGVTENDNTNWLVTTQPAMPLTDKTFTIKLASSNKSVLFVFDFSSTGGAYTLVFNGSSDDDTFTRNISQTPNSNPPLDRTYVFLVS